MITRTLEKPQGSFFLFGPRGTGKTTWLNSTCADAYVVNLLKEDKYQAFLADAGLFAKELQAFPKGQWIVVDEVQRLPNLLNEVHRLIEEAGLKFVLCGSSARKLKRAGVNLLGGRAVRRAMHPFTPQELGDAFNLADALRYGLLPGVWNVPVKAKDEALEAYTQVYLKEEIQAEALVRNLPGFARFLPIAAMYHGQAMNVSNTASEAGVARTTVTDYLEILEETLLCFRLPAFEARLRLRERSHPKWYWCDPGVVRAMKRSYGPVLPEEQGALFEGLVAQTLRASRDYLRVCDDIYYWAPSSGSAIEVDFLLTKGDSIIAVEAKSGSHFSDSWCKGLRAVSGLKNLQRRIVVYSGTTPLRTNDGIDVMPFKSFSDLLVSPSFW